MATRDILVPPSTTMEENPQSWKDWFHDLYYNLSIKNHQTITAASVVSSNARFVRLRSSGAGYAITLDAPTVPGIYKVIQKVSNNADNITMALTNCFGGSAATTCTWNSINDIIVLVSVDNSKWYILSYNGVAFT